MQYLRVKINLTYTIHITKSKINYFNRNINIYVKECTW